jgi:hypothetical protein
MSTTPTTPPPDLWAFLRELVLRLKAKNPTFFNVLSWISGIAFILTGLPQLIALIPGVVLPDPIDLFANKIAATATAVMFIMANLGVQRPVFKHDSGETVTLVDGDRTNLPFTDKKEVKLPSTEMVKTTETNLQ